jgi:hypothetical protein
MSTQIYRAEAALLVSPGDVAANRLIVGHGKRFNGLKLLLKHAQSAGGGGAANTINLVFETCDLPGAGGAGIPPPAAGTEWYTVQNITDTVAGGVYVGGAYVVQLPTAGAAGALQYFELLIGWDVPIIGDWVRVTAYGGVADGVLRITGYPVII